MDLAQMLVIGGCAITGASLGVTIWKLSQSNFIKRFKKKKPEEDAAESAVEGAVDGDDLDAVSDAEIIEDAPESSETDDAVGEDAEADGEDVSGDEEESPPEDVEDAELAEEVGEEPPAETPEEVQPEVAEPPAASIEDEIESIEAEIAQVREAPAKTEFETETAAVLGEIAGKLHESLDRLSKLELLHSEMADRQDELITLGADLAAVAQGLKARPVEVEPVVDLAVEDAGLEVAVDDLAEGDLAEEETSVDALSEAELVIDDETSEGLDTAVEEPLEDAVTDTALPDDVDLLEEPEADLDEETAVLESDEELAQAVGEEQLAALGQAEHEGRSLDVGIDAEVAKEDAGEEAVDDVAPLDLPRVIGI